MNCILATLLLISVSSILGEFTLPGTRRCKSHYGCLECVRNPNDCVWAMVHTKTNFNQMCLPRQEEVEPYLAVYLRARDETDCIEYFLSVRVPGAFSENPRPTAKPGDWAYDPPAPKRDRYPVAVGYFVPSQKHDIPDDPPYLYLTPPNSTSTPAPATVADFAPVLPPRSTIPTTTTTSTTTTTPTTTTTLPPRRTFTTSTTSTTTTTTPTPTTRRVMPTTTPATTTQRTTTTPIPTTRQTTPTTATTTTTITTSSTTTRPPSTTSTSTTTTAIPTATTTTTTTSAPPPTPTVETTTTPKTTRPTLPPLPITRQTTTTTTSTTTSAPQIIPTDSPSTSSTSPPPPSTTTKPIPSSTTTPLPPQPPVEFIPDSHPGNQTSISEENEMKIDAPPAPTSTNGTVNSTELTPKKTVILAGEMTNFNISTHSDKDTFHITIQFGQDVAQTNFPAPPPPPTANEAVSDFTLASQISPLIQSVIVLLIALVVSITTLVVAKYCRSRQN